MEFIGTCASSKIARKAESCKRKLNKKVMNSMVKKEYPELYNELALHLYNPYNYYQSSKYYVLVHSSIDYVFLK